RRVQGSGKSAALAGTSPDNRGAAREELSAIRAGLHDLESKLDRIESRLVSPGSQGSETPRARVIDFVSAGPPLASATSVTPQAPSAVAITPTDFTPPTHSPWSRDFVPDHPSLERFDVEEAAVSELVEFFENEKKCAVEPGGKPCDHCAMCSSRGF